MDIQPAAGETATQGAARREATGAVQRWTLESLKKLDIATLMKMCEDFGAAHGWAKKVVLIRHMTVGNYIQIVSYTVESCATQGGDEAVTTTVDEPAVDDYVGLDVHEHPLAETARRTTAWTCDMPNCGKSTRPRYRCHYGCDFDLCVGCWVKGKERHAV